MSYVRKSARAKAEQWIVEDIDDLNTPITHADIDTSYVERSQGYRTVIDLEKIPATEIIIYVYGLANESGGDIEVYDVTNSQQLAEILNMANADAWNNSGWTALPANVLGTTITITVRVRGSSATEDIEIHRLTIMLRRN